MMADERISDVIGALQVEDQPCRRVQHRLESAQEVDWDADQHAQIRVFTAKQLILGQCRIGVM